jgi:hypothetical protein
MVFLSKWTSYWWSRGDLDTRCRYHSRPYRRSISTIDPFLSSISSPILRGDTPWLPSHFYGSIRSFSLGLSGSPRNWSEERSGSISSAPRSSLLGSCTWTFLRYSPILPQPHQKAYFALWQQNMLLWLYFGIFSNPSIPQSRLTKSSLESP